MATVGRGHSLALTATEIALALHKIGIIEDGDICETTMEIAGQKLVLEWKNTTREVELDLPAPTPR